LSDLEILEKLEWANFFTNSNKSTILVWNLEPCWAVITNINVPPVVIGWFVRLITAAVLKF
jgi:hypothetical protein